MKQSELFEEGRRGRDEGIERASSHAEQVNPGWNTLAMERLKEFLQVHHGPFLAEELRAYCALQEDFPLPPSSRAFGGIMMKARKEGLIQKIGIQPVTNPKAHMANAGLWIKAS